MFVGVLISYLLYLCLLAYSDVQHILCCDFVSFVLGLCTQCCQFLWFVHFWLPHLCSSTIYIIVTDMEAIWGYTDCPRFVVRTTTQEQSVYPDIALHISNHCVYCIEDHNLTHIIHFSDVTLLFEQWIIFKNLHFILLFLNIWTLTFYCFRLKHVIYIFWGFRVSNHCWAF